MKDEANLLIQSVHDFLTPKMLKYALLPFIITIIGMYLLFFILAGAGLEQLGTLQVQSTQTSMQNGVTHTEEIATRVEGSAIIEFLMSYAITSWIVSFLVYAVGGFLVLYISIFVAVLVIGFLTPPILIELQKRHYQEIAMLGDSTVIEGIFTLLKYAAIMLLLFFLFIPLYFIPLINIVALNFPLYYFFHKMMTYDIASNICTKEEDKKIRFFSSNSLRAKTFMLYLLSLVPFAIFFGAIFFVIYLGHVYFMEVKKIRA